MNKEALQRRQPLSTFNKEEISNSVSAWAEHTTKERSLELSKRLLDKENSVKEFFNFIKKNPEEVTVPDVERWLKDMRKRELSPNTRYTRISRLVSFYDWLLSKTPLGNIMHGNPARPVRPKFPTPYQSESIKSYTDDEIKALFQTMREEAIKGTLVAKRDYALMLFYFLSGLRRNEVIGLRGKDIEILDATMIIKSKRKGGKYQNKELAAPIARKALLDYLESAGRLNIIGINQPVWVRHDFGVSKKSPTAMTSYAFDRNLKHYAELAGVTDARIHRFRHTFARIVSEETGSVLETQEALDHSNQQNTFVYVQKLGIKKDKHSEKIAGKLGDIIKG